MFDNITTEIKEIIRIVSRCEEFTYYSILNFIEWENGQEEIFECLKNVYTWGKLYCLEAIKPYNQEIKDWILYNGYIPSEFGPDHIIGYVLYKSDVISRLKSKCSDKEFDAIALIVKDVFNVIETNYSDLVPDHKLVFDLFVKQAQQRTLSPIAIDALETIKYYGYLDSDESNSKVYS